MLWPLHWFRSVYSDVRRGDLWCCRSGDNCWREERVLSRSIDDWDRVRSTIPSRHHERSSRFVREHREERKPRLRRRTSDVRSRWWSIVSVLERADEEIPDRSACSIHWTAVWMFEGTSSNVESLRSSDRAFAPNRQSYVLECHRDSWCTLRIRHPCRHRRHRSFSNVCFCPWIPDEDLRLLLRHFLHSSLDRVDGVSLVHVVWYLVRRVDVVRQSVPRRSHRRHRCHPLRIDPIHRWPRNPWDEEEKWECQSEEEETNRSKSSPKRSSPDSSPDRCSSSSPKISFSSSLSWSSKDKARTFVFFFFLDAEQNDSTGSTVSLDVRSRHRAFAECEDSHSRLSSRRTSLWTTSSLLPSRRSSLVRSTRRWTSSNTRLSLSRRSKGSLQSSQSSDDVHFVGTSDHLDSSSREISSEGKREDRSDLGTVDQRSVLRIPTDDEDRTREMAGNTIHCRTTRWTRYSHGIDSFSSSSTTTK